MIVIPEIFWLMKSALSTEFGLAFDRTTVSYRALDTLSTFPSEVPCVRVPRWSHPVLSSSTAMNCPDSRFGVARTPELGLPVEMDVVADTESLYSVIFHFFS